MQSSQAAVLNQCLLWVKKGYQPFLATVVETYGSSPRPQGSLMAWCPEEGIVGSLSGGCIEEILITQLECGEVNTPSLNIYGKTTEEQTRLQLPCGGHLKILLEQFNTQTIFHLTTLLDALHNHHDIYRRVDTATGQFSELTDTITSNKLTDAYWQQKLSPDFELLLIGAGEVSRCVAHMALNLNFNVSLCDYRETFLTGWHVEGVPIYRTMPDDLIAQKFSHQHCAILCLAHDPRLDDMALMQALKSDAFYIGAMGSKKTTLARKQRLADLDLSAKEINKLHAPIGINIPSKTPYEIAISIMAELIQAKYS
jgi:xanthine dehydrogenase accessory factor